MSTLNVSNITDGTDTVGTSYVVNGSAKAWVTINQKVTQAFKDSFNTSSLTDNSTGETTVTFSSSFDNTNYSVVTGSVGESNHTRGGFTFGLAIEGNYTPTSLTVSACRMRSNYGSTTSANGGQVDLGHASASYIGDLA
jgi:hypothetical protein